MQDICFGDVTLRQAASLTDWNATVRAFLAHSAKTPDHLGAVLAAEPDFAMGHAVKGIFCVLLGRSEMMATAAEALLAAEAGAAETPRERAYVAALRALLAGSPSGAIQLLEQVLLSNPRDTLSMKLSHALRFILGDAKGMRSSIERVLGAHGEDHPLRGYLLGCHAFALEETGDYQAAEKAGLSGLEYTDDDAWGLHAVAHVYDMTARSKEGISLIDRNCGTWLHCNNFRYHVWWHKALLHLDEGDVETVLSLYDAKIRADKTDDYRDIANASSLLMRLELEGQDVGNRWEELADLSENRVEDGCLVFADLHYMLSLVGGDRAQATARLLGRIRQDGQTPEVEMDHIFMHPGTAFATGLAAFGEGRYATAFTYMNKARGAMQTVGGSHAQRDVFERLTIDAGIRAGQLDQAETILRSRKAQRAGAEDRFATTRFATIAAARREAITVPAE